jgi:hypothetical protein
MDQPTDAIDITLYVAGICAGGLVLLWSLGFVLVKIRDRKARRLWEDANDRERERARYMAHAEAEWRRTSGPTHPECPTCRSPLVLQDGPLYGSRLLVCSGLDCDWAERLQEEATEPIVGSRTKRESSP